MFQPFEIFKPVYIERLIKLNKTYIVSQSYKHGSDHFTEPKIDLLFSDFDHLGTAQIHYSAVKNDKYASIINLANIKHKEKVMEMLAADSKYRVYWAIVKDISEIKKRLDFNYTHNIRRYIEVNTTWRIGSDETIKPSLQVVFGELFIMLRRGSQTLRVKFDEIEKA